MDRAVIFGCAGPALAPAERRFFAAAESWGFILFARHWPDFAVLRQDPRFVALIRELDKPAGGTIDS